MKIIQKIHQAPTKVFANMPTGEVFKWENAYFLKITEHIIYLENVDTTRRTNALNLKTNTLDFFSSEEEVIPIKADLTVDY